MPYDKTRVARRLKSLRNDKGWSQTDLSQKSKVSLSSVASCETARSGISLNTAYDLTEALDCSLEQLVCRERKET